MAVPHLASNNWYSKTLQMKRWPKLLIIPFAVMFFLSHSSHASAWDEIAGKHDNEWFSSPEGKLVTSQVIAFQYPSGGWPKNEDMATPTPLETIREIVEGPDHSTIDNKTSYTHVHYLAKAFSVTGDESAKKATLKGLDYLFESQYPTGGWPVYYPRTGGYYGAIHYNDNSIYGLLRLLKDIVDGKSEVRWMPEDYVKKAESSLKSGIQCILNSQVRVDGRLTVWCAQHDPVTLKPVAARAFEPVSLSGFESAYLALFLMSLKNPGPPIVKAVEASVQWFEETQINDIALRIISDAAGNKDRRLIEEAGAETLWARFYEIGTNRPIFAGRDRIIHYEYDQIERERRVGYSYFSSAPNKLLKQYPKWRASLRGE